MDQESGPAEDIQGTKFEEGKLDFLDQVDGLLEGIWEIDVHPFREG